MSKPVSEVVEIHVDAMYKHSIEDDQHAFPVGFDERLRKFVKSELGENGHLKEVWNRPMEPAKNLYFMYTTRWVKLEPVKPGPAEVKETLTGKAERIASVLHKKLGSKELEDLLILLSDYDTDARLCQALRRLDQP